MAQENILTGSYALDKLKESFQIPRYANQYQTFCYICWYVLKNSEYYFDDIRITIREYGFEVSDTTFYKANEYIWGKNVLNLAPRKTAKKSKGRPRNYYSLKPELSGAKIQEIKDAAKIWQDEVIN